MNFRLAGLLDGAGLWHAMRLVADVFGPIALCTAGLFTAAYLLCLHSDERWRLYLDNHDRQVIVEQFERAASVPTPDIAFVGDSSCLMGIDAGLLHEVLSGTSVESLCTIAFAGPVGYGRLVTTLMDRGATPKTLIISIHPDPIETGRSPVGDWASYPDLTPRRSPALPSPIEVLDYLRIRWLGWVLYQPLEQEYGLYYGSDAAFRALLRRSHGSVVEPSVLDARSVEELGRMTRYARPRFGQHVQSFAPSSGFLNALELLGPVIARLDRRRVFILVTPVPDSTFPPAGADARQALALTIAAHLGLSKSQILPVPGHLPDMYFSSVTHLNRWGRTVYTRALADQLRTLVSEPLAGSDANN